MTRLFVVDLDETLLHLGSLPHNTLPALRRIMFSGAPVTIATARGFRAAISPLADAIPRLPIIALNGAVLASLNETETTVEAIEPRLVAPVCRLGAELGATPCLLETDGRNESVFVSARGDAFTDWSINAAVYFKAQDVIRDRSPTIAERARIVRVVFCTTVPIAQQLDRRVKEMYPALTTAAIWSRDQPGFAWLEIGGATATKAHGVANVASLLKLTMAEVVYYGDAGNDLAAMTMVGEAVAVSNADAEVLKIADRIIGSAESGAVVVDILKQLGMPSQEHIEQKASADAARPRR